MTSRAARPPPSDQKAFPNGATSVEIGGQAGHVAANNRHTGFTKGIKGKNITGPGLQEPDRRGTTDQAQAIAADMITKYGDKIQFIFCHWDNGATGVIQALKAVGPGWANKVMIVAVDGNKTGFPQVESWPNYISIAQNAETITSKVMEQSMLFIKKDRRRSRTTSSRSTSSPRRRSTTSPPPSGRSLI